MVGKSEKEAQIAYEMDSYGPDLSHFEGGKQQDEEEVQQVQNPVRPDTSRKRNKSTKTTYFAPRNTPRAQSSIKSALARKEAIWRADMAIGRFFYDACIPAYAVNSFYFKPMLDAIAAIGPGYKGPSYYQLRVNLLKDAKKEAQLLVDSYRENWAKVGCTIMGDGWTDVGQRTFINFLVYCPQGVSFVKSVDASNVVKDANNLFLLFDEIISWVGPSNVVHIVTDNATNYVAPGRLIHSKYNHINWSPCAAHCLNLIFKDICKLDHIAELSRCASKVTIFVYNHVVLLSWLRKREGWKDIIRPGATWFATTFIALKSLYDHKHDLQALVTSKFFVDSRCSKDGKSKVVVSIVLNTKFWNDCLIVVQLMAPLVRLLRIVNCDERPSMGYVYEGMYRARLGIKKLFNNNKRLYKPYTSIIKEGWDSQLRKSIHAAGYWLNPCFQYDQVNFCSKPEVIGAVMDMIDQKVIKDKEKVLTELKIYRERLESFGEELAYTTHKSLSPDEWWRLHGYSAPNLQKLAIQILSQTTSSSGYERNWTVFEQIHTKKRNQLEHQRLNDLVYIHYNLRLKHRFLNKKRNYDPIDYACIDETGFWIIDENEPRELDLEELESFLYDEWSFLVEVEDSNPIILIDELDGGGVTLDNVELENFTFPHTSIPFPLSNFIINE